MSVEEIINQILIKRGIDSVEKRERFLNPDYTQHLHDPYLLNDMDKAVTRLIQAKEKNEIVYIYGDYDIDGLTATTVLMDAFSAFGIKAEAYIPDRFEEGYGLNIDALKKIHKLGGQLVVTVDCGSTSVEVVEQAKSFGMELVITDHHTVGEQLPDAAAVVNPKRLDNTYPFIDLAGVGVAFKLVQALQQKLDGLPAGQEKWLLDLVALGTVCDVVGLVDENRLLVKWGLEVWKQTRRHGLKALMEVSAVKNGSVDTTVFGFRVGPRLNAAGRIEHALTSLAALTANNRLQAQSFAQKLDRLNADRRAQQKHILESARAMAAEDLNPVLVVASRGWSHGIVGIVASKLMEEFSKPTFVFEIMPEKKQAKGSARSFGDFSAVDAIRAFDQRISGGGHAAAAGVAIYNHQVDDFRREVNDYYHSLELKDQSNHLAVEPDIELEDFSLVKVETIDELLSLGPFGRYNPEPTFRLRSVHIVDQRLVGSDKNHLQIRLEDKCGQILRGIMFNRAELIDRGKISPVVCFIKSDYRPGEVEFQIKQL